LVFNRTFDLSDAFVATLAIEAPYFELQGSLHGPDVQSDAEQDIRERMTQPITATDAIHHCADGMRR
jgi:hypothetical protein